MSSTTVTNLLATARDEGLLSAASAHTLTVGDLGTQIQAGLGVHVDDVSATEVILVGILVDNSISMKRMEREAIDGHNQCLDGLSGSKEAGNVLVLTRTFTDVLQPFTTLGSAVRLTDRLYVPRLGNTPLNDAVLALLGTMAAKTQEFADNGVPVRSISVLVSDGGDNASRHTATEVAQVTRDLLAAENHIVAGMGIDDGFTDFNRVFGDMGIPNRPPNNWVLTPGNSPSEIRRAFLTVSQSVSQASQTANLATLGGFAS